METEEKTMKQVSKEKTFFPERWPRFLDIIRIHGGHVIPDNRWHKLRETCKVLLEETIGLCWEPIRILVKTEVDEDIWGPTLLQKQLNGRKVAIYMNYRPSYHSLPCTTLELGDIKSSAPWEWRALDGDTEPSVTPVVTEFHFTQSIWTHLTKHSRLNVNLLHFTTRLLNTGDLERLVWYDALQEDSMRWGEDFDLFLLALLGSNLKSITLAQKDDGKTVMHVLGPRILDFLPHTLERLSLSRVPRDFSCMKPHCRPSTLYLDATIHEDDLHMPVLSGVKHLHINDENFVGNQNVQTFLDQAPMLETFHYNYFDPLEQQIREDALWVKPTVTLYYKPSRVYPWADKDWWNDYGAMGEPLNIHNGRRTPDSESDYYAISDDVASAGWDETDTVSPNEDAWD